MDPWWTPSYRHESDATSPHLVSCVPKLCPPSKTCNAVINVLDMVDVPGSCSYLERAELAVVLWRTLLSVVRGRVFTLSVFRFPHSHQVLSVPLNYEDIASATRALGPSSLFGLSCRSGPAPVRAVRLGERCPGIHTCILV